jgi:hypothetical protein
MPQIVTNYFMFIADHEQGIHAVDPEHLGKNTAAVFYIGAVPGCRKNEEHLALQAENFRLGYAPPDFRTDDASDGEARFVGFKGEKYEMSTEARRAMAL